MLLSCLKYISRSFYLKLETKIKILKQILCTINVFNLVLQIPKMNWRIMMIGKHLTLITRNRETIVEYHHRIPPTVERLAKARRIPV